MPFTPGPALIVARAGKVTASWGDVSVTVSKREAPRVLGRLGVDLELPEPSRAPKGARFGALALMRAVRLTCFAAHSGVAGLRYALNGVLFDVDGRRARLVATDGNRLSLAELAIQAATTPMRVVIPPRALSFLGPLSPTRTVEISADAGRVFLRAAGSVIEARQVAGKVAGKFPPYAEAIPEEGAGVTVRRAGLLRGLPNSKAREQTIRLAIAGGELAIGQGVELRAQHLRDVLRALAPLEEVKLELGAGPAVVRAPGFVHVLNPLS